MKIKTVSGECECQWNIIETKVKTGVGDLKCECQWNESKNWRHRMCSGKLKNEKWNPKNNVKEDGNIKRKSQSINNKKKQRRIYGGNKIIRL